MDMGTHTEYTIEKFEAGDINPARFDHEAHIYVGWLYMTTYERAEAIARFDAALRRLTAKVGATNKYNAMITWLFLLLIAARATDGERLAQLPRPQQRLVRRLPATRPPPRPRTAPQSAHRRLRKSRSQPERAAGQAWS